MLLRKQILLFVLFLIGTGLYASSLKGTITGVDNKPLFGASVRVLNTSLGTVTSEKGAYQINRIRGKVDIEVSFIGYKTLSKEVVVNGDTELNVTLEEAPFVYQDVVVKATRVGEKTPFAHQNIDAKELAEIKNGEEIPALLNRSQSLVTFSENGTPFGNTSFRIRGSDPSRINVTVDGMPLNDAESQAVFWVNMTDFAESVEDIQIQRGVGTSTNGAAAFGASVNFQTKGYEADPFAEVVSTVGSYGTFKNSVQVNSGLMKDHWVFNARLSDLKTDGYIDYSGMAHQSYFISGGYYSENTIVRLKTWSNNEHTQISWWGVDSATMLANRTFNPAGQYTDLNGNQKYYEDQADNYKQTHYHLHATQRLNENFSLNGGLFYTKGLGYYEQFQDDGNWFHHTNFSDYGFPNAAYYTETDTLYASDLTRQKWLDNDYFGGTFNAELKMENLEVILGVAANRYDGDHFGNILWVEQNPGIPVDHEWYTNRSQKNDMNTFVKANYGLSDNLNIYADLQYRFLDYKLAGIHDDLNPFDLYKTYKFFNPKGGLFYQNNAHRAFASVGVSHREPTRANIIDAMPDPNVGDISPQPKEEELIDFELGYNYVTSTLNLSANLFYMLYNDQLTPTGGKNSVGYDLMENVDKSYRRGVELAASWSPVRVFRWDVNATLSENKIEVFEEYLDESILKVHENTNLSYSPGIVGSNVFTVYPFKGFSVQLISKYVGEQYYDNTSEAGAKIDAYLVNDVAVAYNFNFAGLANAEVKLKVNNVLDEKYVANAYGGKYEDNGVIRWTSYFPQAPMNFLAQLKLRF